VTEIYIQATGDYCEPCGEDSDIDLKPLVADAIGQPVRRIGRFIQLALIGAGRCAKAAKLPDDTSVYFGSGRGDLEITIEVMQTLLRDGHAPKPLSFINTVSNAACFYIAQSLRLMSRSSFVCNRYFAFEAVALLAAMDLRTNAVASALVGAVDIVVPPLADHRKRLGLAADALVGDASHWLCFRNEYSNDALGRLLTVESFADAEAMHEWMRRQPLGKGSLLASGQFIEETEVDELSQRYAFGARFDYRSKRPYYDSQTGAVIGEFLRDVSLAQTQLLHVNRDPDGRYCVMLIEKC
jgi:hypothetical protein